MIIFVYQDPEQAWRFVKARESVEGRRVPPEAFVEQFINSQAVVSELKKEFRDQVDIIFMEKNLDGTKDKPYFNVADIDAMLDKKCTREPLEAIASISKSS